MVLLAGRSKVACFTRTCLHLYVTRCPVLAEQGPTGLTLGYLTSTSVGQVGLNKLHI